MKRILISAGSILGAKGINLVVMLLTVPLTYNYLGEERFGVLMLVLSMVMLMSFADLGLGFGLLNKIAVYDVAGDNKSIKKAVSSTFLFLCSMSIGILMLFSVGFSAESLGDVFNIETLQAQVEAKYALQVFIICFCMALPFTIVTKLQAGYQEIHLNQIWEAAGNIFSLIALYVAVKSRAGVPIILLSIYGSQCAFIILNFGYQFLIRRRFLFPSLTYWSSTMFKEIFRDALMICSLQISSIIINSIDSILIARVIDPIAVGAYAIGYRLFSMFIMPIQAFISSILPAINDAIASADVRWILRGIRKVTIGVVITSLLLGILFMCCANAIISIWISEEAHLTLPLILAFGTYVTFHNISSLLFHIMMSPIFLKRLFVLFSISAIVIIGLKLVFVNSFHYSSVLWATMIGATVFFIIPGFVIVYLRLHQMNRELVLT